MAVHFQKNKLAVEVNRAINGEINRDFSIDTSQDVNFMADKPYSWDDLTNLKNELGRSIIEFVGQVTTIITNPEVIKYVTVRKEHFEQLVKVFFADIDEVSKKVKALREQHEGKTGHVNDINEFNHYNRLAISYHTLFGELTTLVTPTLSELMLTISELVPKNPTQVDVEAQPKE